MFVLHGKVCALITFSGWITTADITFCTFSSALFILYCTDDWTKWANWSFTSCFSEANYRPVFSFKCYLYHRISWSSRLIGIKGARGLGKTTLVLQYLHEQHLLQKTKIAYFSLDQLIFTDLHISKLVEYLYLQAYTIFGFDETHKYPNWALNSSSCMMFIPIFKLFSQVPQLLN